MAVVVKPDPDPTLLTTENLRREISHLKELTAEKLETQLTRVDAIEHRLDHKYTETAEAIKNLHKLILANIETLASVMSQRFESIAIQFTERDKRTEQLSLADKTAIAAALQAQKEAAGAQNESNAASVTKQEAAFTKLLDQNQVLFHTSMSALTTQINDLKSRLDTGEGQSKGKGDMWGYAAGVAGLAIAAAALFLKH